MLIDGEPERIAGPGTLVYFPPNLVHSTVALPDEDVVFFVVKDLNSWYRRPGCGWDDERAAL